MLRDVLTILKLKSGPYNTAGFISLHRWHWSAEMGAVVAQALPAPGDGVSTISEAQVGAITDDVLTGILHLGAHVERVYGKGLSLESDQHRNAPWTWKALHLTSPVDLMSVLRLPRPAMVQQPQGAPEGGGMRSNGDVSPDKGVVSCTCGHGLSL